MGICLDANSACLMNSPRKSKAKLKSNVMPIEKLGFLLCICLVFVYLMCFFCSLSVFMIS